ncbi:MAG: pimeloyl-ACP methyl ester carboxylesterase [Roseivirga sp.]|jgi:pimeloyl-ACP methyl ester carboxylesterase
MNKFKTTLMLTVMSIFSLQLSAQKPGLDIRVMGEGPPVVLIPGLTCSGEVWDSTIAALDAGYEYHIITLPGFAGNAPLNDHEGKYLEKMRDEVIQYIENKQLSKPIIIGHSLGGFLALNIAIIQPNLPSKLVIVDALPFMTAVMIPGMTADEAKGMAKSMKSQVVSSVSQPIENRKAYQRQMLTSMINDAAQIEIATDWAIDSDQETVGESMYEMYTTDIREELSKIKVPTLVLGAWLAYKDFGSTRESTLKLYTDQYANLKGVKVDMTDIGNHFIMWDDPEFFQSWLKKFL